MAEKQHKQLEAGDEPVTANYPNEVSHLKESINQQFEISRIDEKMEALPEVQAEKDLWQNKFHEFDVYNHTIEFVKNLKKILRNENRNLDPDLLAAAWLHDIGKVTTAKPRIKNGVHEEREIGKPYHEFHDHEIEGARMVEKMDPAIFKNLNLNQQRIAELVSCHYLPMKGIKKMRSAANWTDFLNQYEGLKLLLKEKGNPEEILLMFLADKLAQGNPERYCTDQEELFIIRSALLEKDKAKESQLLKKIYEMQGKGSRK